MFTNSVWGNEKPQTTLFNFTQPAKATCGPILHESQHIEQQDQSSVMTQPPLHEKQLIQIYKKIKSESNTSEITTRSTAGSFSVS
ncbi:hypothetical protein HW555_003244 [Spodoptera exigua]|uniref:Uncharacterized protein n=1 Tax=Spodoptera exigua TaxID=7107 RepID=A0A835L6A9_SPOEX|nr:hypothetical protein HW555_003244 [Spodoptera exigua]